MASYVIHFQGQNKYSEYIVTFVRNNTSIRPITHINVRHSIVKCLMDAQALSLLLILVSLPVALVQTW
jgi:hypothetical protein